MASTSTDPTTLGTVVRVWMIGTSVWGKLWERHFGLSPLDEATGELTPTAVMWARGLGEFPRAVVLRALEDFMLRGVTFPPNLAELRRACVGIPSLAEVRADLGRKNMPFTLLVWEKLDPWDFGHADQRRAHAMLEDAYQWAADHRMRGAALPALPAPAGEGEKSPQAARTISPAEVRAWLDRIRAQLGAGGEKPMPEAGNHDHTQGGTEP